MDILILHCFRKTCKINICKFSCREHMQVQEKFRGDSSPQLPNQGVHDQGRLVSLSLSSHRTYGTESRACTLYWNIVFWRDFAHGYLPAGSAVCICLNSLVVHSASFSMLNWSFFFGKDILDERAG